jgi:5-methyltetrahydrofolate--homocysteine methyltransferase
LTIVKLLMHTPVNISQLTFLSLQMHTAVKISPVYSGPVVYVLDASRSVPVCQTLLDRKSKEAFVEDIKEQYNEMRDEFYAGLEDRKYLPLGDCQKKCLKVGPVFSIFARLPQL